MGKREDSKSEGGKLSTFILEPPWFQQYQEAENFRLSSASAWWNQARYVGNRKKSGIFLHLLGGGNTPTFLPAPSSICIYLAQGIISLPVVNEAWSFPSCCCQKDERKERKSRSLKRWRGKEYKEREKESRWLYIFLSKIRTGNETAATRRGHSVNKTIIFCPPLLFYFYLLFGKVGSGVFFWRKPFSFGHQWRLAGARWGKTFLLKGEGREKEASAGVVGTYEVTSQSCG